MMSGHFPPDRDASVGLRERRRRETSRELADAAIDLFERHGVHGTTVDDIAAVAGVSPRTFFRYAETKERALFLDDEDLKDVLEQVRAVIDAGGSATEALRSVVALILDAFDAAGEVGQKRRMRVRRLVFAEPSLLAVALARDAQHDEELVQVIRTAPDGLDDLSARTLVTTMSASIRLAFDEWARRVDAGQHASVRSLHDQIQVILHEAAHPDGRPSG